MPLTDNDVMSDLAPGRYSLGLGLYLHVRSAAARSWVALLNVKGKRYEFALGPAIGPGKPGVTLNEARAKAAEKLEQRNAGTLLASRQPPPPPPTPPEVRTFGFVANEWFDSKYSKEVTAKTVENMRRLMKRRAAKLWAMDVRAITSADVEEVLAPIWTTTNRSASDLRQKLEKVFGYAAAKTDDATGHTYRDRAAPNPADWNVLQHLLPKAESHVEHHESVPYQALPGVMEKVRAKKNRAARALELATLCAVRTAECRLARVQEFEFDSDKPVWTIPAARLKRKTIRDSKGKTKPAPPHRVPLSRQAVALLRELIPDGAAPEDLIFEGEKAGQPIGHNAMAHTLQRVTTGTPHGMRASFSTWRAEQAKQFDWRLAEAALAHTYKGEVEGAYNRSDALELRRPLMQAWADYLDGTESTPC